MTFSSSCAIANALYSIPALFCNAIEAFRLEWSPLLYRQQFSQYSNIKVDFLYGGGGGGGVGATNAHMYSSALVLCPLQVFADSRIYSFKL